MMFSPLWAVVGWSLALSMVAFAYGEYTRFRQAQGRPIGMKERFRNYLFLYAIFFGLFFTPALSGIRLPLATRFFHWRVIATFALMPLGLWYLFDWPLRLARHYSNVQRGEPSESHPLDGAWSAKSSFLDRITASRTPSTAADRGRQLPQDFGWLGDHGEPVPSRPAPLDRVAQLRPVVSPPGEAPI